MAETPNFAKPDRYKASSYDAYNVRLPERYDASRWMWFCQAPLLDRTIIEELQPSVGSLDILDVGCATGRLLAKLAAAGAHRLSGTDLAPRILEVARGKLAAQGADADLRSADAEDALPWRADSFDVVTLVGVLHHFYRPHEALREIHRVLRSSGRLVVVDPCFFSPIRQVLNLWMRVAPHDGDYRFYAPKRAAALLESADFRPTTLRRVGLWSYLVAAVLESTS
jgi:ubiquinone/menaquinone biosynthesis C-methylase UbiE